jgi:hypothetical protein
LIGFCSACGITSPGETSCATGRVERVGLYAVRDGVDVAAIRSEGLRCA